MTRPFNSLLFNMVWLWRSMRYTTDMTRKCCSPTDTLRFTLIQLNLFMSDYQTGETTRFMLCCRQRVFKDDRKPKHQRPLHLEQERLFFFSPPQSLSERGEKKKANCCILTSPHFSPPPSCFTVGWLQPIAKPEPGVPHRANPSPLLAAWFCITSTNRAHGMHSARHRQTAVAPVPRIRSRSHVLWVSCLSGVRWPAWSRATAASLSSAPPPPPPANRSPARWSPGRRRKLRTPHPHLSPPLLKPTLLLPFLIVFGLCSFCTASLYRTEACLHKQKSKNSKTPRQKDKNRLCTIQRADFFAQRLYIFHARHLCWGSSLNQTVSRMFVSCLVKWGGGGFDCGAFVALKAERSNILFLGAMRPDEDTGGDVTYMHLHLHARIQHWDDAYLIPAHSLQTGCAVTDKHHHTRTNVDVWRHAKSSSVCHITRALCCIWWVVYRSKWVWVRVRVV